MNATSSVITTASGVLNDAAHPRTMATVPATPVSR